MARKKREKEIKDSISFELAKKAVEEGRFVITADQIRGKHGRTVNGQGADTDTLVASVKAYLNALNKLLVKRGKHAPSALSA